MWVNNILSTSEATQDLLGTILVLNPVLRLRPDRKRALLFHADPIECARSPFTRFLHPRQALFLSLFNGRLTLKEVISVWSDITKKGMQAAVEEVIHFLEEQRSLGEEILIPPGGTSVAPRAYDPEDFFPEGDEIDLASTRCYIPTTFTHEVCYQCAVQCVYCYSDLPNRKGNLLATQRLKEIISEAAALGIPRIGMSGGDPFCHPDIFRILEIYGDYGIGVDVPTKTPLGERAIARLIEFPHVRIQFSIDGVNPEINDRLVGVKGHTDRMIKTLQTARNSGLVFSVNTVLTPLNYRQGAEMVPFLMDHFGDHVRRISLSPYGRSIYRHRDELFLQPTALAWLEDMMSSFRKRYPGRNISMGGAPAAMDPDPEKRRSRYRERALCTGNRSAFVLLPDGMVTACEELYYHTAFIMGDLRTQSIMEMWEGEQALFLARPDQASVSDGACAVCPEFDECHTLRGRCFKRTLQAYGTDRPHWPDPSCPYAPPGSFC